RVAARSSSAQRVTVCWCSVVVPLAKEITSSRCEGGKAPRPTRPRSILKPGQPPLEIAVSPDPGGVAIAGELGGDLEVGGLVVVSDPQDQTTAKDQGLRRGTGPHQGLEPSPVRSGPERWTRSAIGRGMTEIRGVGGESRSPERRIWD